MKLKRYKKNYTLFIILVLLNTYFILERVGERLIHNVENIIVNDIDKSVNSYLFTLFNDTDMTSEEMLDVIYLNMNSNNEVISVEYRFDLAYKYLDDAMNNLYNNLNDIEYESIYLKKKKDIYYLPTGLSKRNLLFDNFGFNVPCKINVINKVDIGFKTKVKNYGVNNLLVELYLVVDVDNDIILPSIYKSFGERYEIIVASKIVMGKIPTFYDGMIEESSTILSS